MRWRITAIILVCILVAATVALTGCDQLIGNAVKGVVQKSAGVSVNETSGSVTVQGQNGKSVTVGGAEGKVPDGFPTEFPQPAGATVKSGAQMTSPQGGVYTVVWETTDSTDQVLSSLKTSLPAAGYTIVSQASGSGSNGTGGVITFKNATQQGAVTVSDQNGKTQISTVITVKQ